MEKNNFAVKETEFKNPKQLGVSGVSCGYPKIILIRKGLSKKLFKITLGHEIFHSRYNNLLWVLKHLFGKKLTEDLIEYMARLYGCYFNKFKSFWVVNDFGEFKLVRVQ